jgi:hypothetical protein
MRSFTAITLMLGEEQTLKIKDVPFNASYSSLDLEELTLEVRNEGNAPPYI